MSGGQQGRELEDRRLDMDQDGLLVLATYDDCVGMEFGTMRYTKD